MSLRLLPRLLACFIPLALQTAIPAADWPQWRGPNRDGISPETGLLDSWPKNGPTLVWKTKGLGEGFSSCAVVRDRLYTQGQSGSTQFVLAFDTANGKQVWKTNISARSFREERGNGPRGTPTVDGNRLYALAADGSLACLDAATGNRVWGMNMVDRFRGRLPNWGIAESPLVDGERLIVTPGGGGASVVALAKSTGELLWKSQSDQAAYSSPMLVDVDRVRQVIVFAAGGAMALDVRNGELQWSYSKVANGTANIATPVVGKGHVFLSSDYGTGCALLKLTPSGGSAGASQVYFNREMRNHYTTSVLVGDYLYGYSAAILTAMKFLTGEVAWKHRGVGKGSCIFAERNLYCQSEDGVIGLIEATPEAYKEKSRFRIPSGYFPSWTPPIVAGGRLYLRDQDNLYCFNIKAQ